MQADKESLTMSSLDQIHNMNPKVPELYALKISWRYINYRLRCGGAKSEVRGAFI